MHRCNFNSHTLTGRALPVPWKYSSDACRATLSPPGELGVLQRFLTITAVLTDKTPTKENGIGGTDAAISEHLHDFYSLLHTIDRPLKASPLFGGEILKRIY